MIQLLKFRFSRFDVNAYYSPIKGQKGKICTRKGGFIDHIDHFDADFFNISPKEAEFLDPQQRLLLKQTWLAFENANINVTNLVNSDTGVFIGLSTHDYEHYIYKNQDPEVVNPYFSTGNSASTASGRLSYFFGLQGPCFGIDTACSSSLAAIDEACMRLQNGACSLAVAGGVNAILCPELYISFSQAGMLSPDGACKTFDANADGYVRGEGCGVIILKRLSDALQDGDSIVAVIKASSIDHDGRSSGLTVPNGQAQQRLIRQTLEKSGLKSSDIHYIECHGTGTTLGDPIEVNAIKESFSDEREDPLFLGSVKANIGHLEAAAGIAGFIKVVLCLKHRIIPPQIHFDSLNPKIKLSRTMQINTQARTIDLNKKFIAGVSSFGFSGTNAHIIVEEPPVIEHAEPQLSTCYVLPVSAQSKESLQRLQKSYSDYCMSHPEVNIAELCYTASVGRAHLSHRLAVSGRSASEIANKLQLIKTYGKVNSTHHNIAFLFSGQGAQYFGMGKELYQNHPVFRHYLDEAALILKKYLEVPLFDILWQKQDLIHVTLYMQPSLLALEYALFKLWESWGVTPSYVMGCGLGEYVAAIAAGIMSFEDGLFLITKQAQLIQGLKADGEMALFEEFTQWAHEISFRSPQINFVSSLTGEMRTAAPTAKYWVDHLLHTVQFESGIHTLIREGCSVFIEVGPHPVLLEPARQCARDTPGLIWTGSLKKQVHDSEAIAEGIAELYNNGFDFAWTCFYKDSYHSKMDLPGYIFDKQSHWLAAVDIPQSEESLDQEWFYQVKWQANKLNKENVAPLQGRWLLLDLDKSLISKKLYHSLKNTGVDCTLATHAQHFNQKGKQWALDYGNKEQINHLIEEVLAQGTLNKIIFAIGTTELAEQEQKIKHYILGMLFLIQALITKKQKPEIWIITQRAQTIGSMSSLAASPLLGLRKVIAFEHPEFSIRTIDLDINTLSEQTIVSEIALNRNEEQVAYRDTQRYVPRLTHAMPPPMVSQVIDPQASYLISGGGSGVGFEIAGWLVEKGAKHVTLMSRRGISEEAMEKVMLWKSNNVSITVCGVDVGDYSQLTEVIRAYGTKLPPLKGIIHAAGALEDGLLLNNNWSHFEKVLQGKQKGAWYLHELSKMMTLDFFVLFSSMVSITGSIGQGNYVAANTYLDHLAYYRRSLNLPATSIQWGPWDEVGMASRRMQDNKDNPFYIQIRPMSLKKCLNMMNALLSYQGNIMVADLESSAFKTAFNSINNQSFISQLILENDAHGEKGEFQKNQFASLSHMEQLVSIQKILLQMISRILKKDKEFIAVDESLYNFGTDSLMQTQFLLEIKNYFGQDLKITLADLHHNFNISALSDLLISRIDIKSKVDVGHLNTHNLDTSCFPLVPHQIEMVDYIKSFPYNRAYHIPFFFKMSGLMPVDKADKALNTLVKNNEILRASIFSLYGQHYHRVHNEIIFHSKTFEITSSQLGEAMVSAYNEPFSLESPPLFRCYIYHVDNSYTVVGLVFCHVICDGMSTISFFKEFINLYDNPDKANTPVPVQFRSYVGWLMQDIYPKIDNELKQFWQDKLQGYDYLHVIEGKPINAIVEPEALPLHGEKTGFSLSQASLAKLEAYAARHSVTLGCLLQAVIHRALAEVSNKADTVVMVFCSGRNLDFQKNIIGPLVQHPLIRCKQIHARPLAEMAQYIREELIETSEYQYMPHFKLKEFQIKSAPVSLDYQYYDLSDLEERFELVSMPDVTIDLWGNDPRHLSFKVYVYAHNKVDFSLKYRPDIYSLEQAKMILDKCKEIISQDLVLN
ncbi:MAG TPA: SDR family NAD(P)-dependent oxidoreductase [Legionella sp.]|nr:SDR family NAD(P)-dependent oxidoreductase [Legionella sp.]